MTTKTVKPQRTCVGCRKRFNQDELLAVTRLKNGEVVVNENHQKAGRSVYLCKKPECLKKAHGRKGHNALKYGLKVEVPDQVFEELQKIIQK